MRYRVVDAAWGGWDEERHTRHFTGSMKQGHISIIEVDGVRVGMIQLLEDDDGVEVRELQIDPEHQNQGIGTEVLLDVIDEMRARGRDLHLKVGLKNEKAMRLYRRLGFSSVSQSETHHHMIIVAADGPVAPGGGDA